MHKNPTYKEVTYGNTGHLEVIEVIYDANLISFEELLKNFWVNIDPFDPYGQFCDKGYSYRSAAFYTNKKEKDLIKKDIIKLEKKFNKKVNTYVREFKKFYVAEDFHQNYYEVYFLNYLKVFFCRLLYFFVSRRKVVIFVCYFVNLFVIFI